MLLATARATIREKTMAAKKQILVVDDHFEILEFLRSMLEQSNADYQVLGVPSAEEGFLEMRRTPFDLLITDVRLPGMSGFELVRKVRQFAPDTPIIMITAYSTAQGKQEAEELGVARYFEKPLDTDALLAAVYTALYQKQPAAPPPASKRQPVATASKPAPGVQDDVRDRLQTLHTDTGAAQIILARREGSILSQVGEQSKIDLQELTRLVAVGLENSFQLAEQLQSREPLTIQYQAGERVDLYTANIGRDYFLMLLFDVQSRRGRIGTVWIFAQRAIKDLKGLLPAAATAAAVPAVDDGATKPLPSRREQLVQANGGLREVEPGSAAEDDAGQVPETANSEAEPEEEPVAAEVAVTEEAAVEVTGEEPELSEVDMAALAEALGGVEPERELDLDAFWDEATSGSGVESDGSGLSFEEAMKRGLLPPEFGDDGDQS
jgi:DNA-binding response OmpR family regulator